MLFSKIHSSMFCGVVVLGSVVGAGMNAVLVMVSLK